MSLNDNKLVLICLFNSEFLLAHMIDQQLAAIALGKRWQPFFVEDKESVIKSFEKFEGEYIMDEYSSFMITVESDKVYFQETGRLRYIADIFEENHLYIREINCRIRFEENKKGEIKYTAFFGHYLYTGKRLQ